MSDDLVGGRPDLRWHLVLPVKGTSDAKSRLQVGPDLGRGLDRVELARAMAMDALDAALASSSVASVLVVTSDARTADAATAAGAQVEPDPGQGLNAAVRRGRDVVASRSGPVAALLADVPALRPQDLTAALSACGAYDAAYVPDAEGDGTVLLAAVRAEDLQPAFGDGSAARHDLVAKRLELDLPRLRRDVDVASALRAAQALGVGERTAALLTDAR